MREATLLKRRVTHSVMKRALTFSDGASFHTRHLNASPAARCPLPLLQSEAWTSGVTDKESQWAPSPERGDALIRTDLKTTTPIPLLLSHISLSLPPSPLTNPGLVSSFVFICNFTFIATFCLPFWLLGFSSLFALVPSNTAALHHFSFPHQLLLHFQTSIFHPVPSMWSFFMPLFTSH